MDRRRFLTLAAGTGLFSGCSGQPAESTRTSTPTISDTQQSPTSSGSPEEGSPTTTPWKVEPVEHDQLIGAHYYHWYNDRENWTRWTATPPVLGNYDSRDEDVINQHVKWALEHGINWFNVSWWGPENGTRGRPPQQGYSIADGFLRASLADRIDISVLYESIGRFERNDDGRIDLDTDQNRARLRSDFAYLQDTLFTRDNYLRIDGRPVVFLYVARNFEGDVTGAFEAARDAIEDDPYLIADVLGPAPDSFDERFFDAFDAASLYSPMIVAEEQFLVDDETDRKGLDQLVPRAFEAYRTWQSYCQEQELDFIPAVLPGFDTRQNDQREYQLYVERSEEAFRSFTQGVHGFTGDDPDAVFVTSWNEWPEDTAVEPGESYGTAYLDIIKSALVVSDSS